MKHTISFFENANKIIEKIDKKKISNIASELASIRKKKW